MTDAGTLREIEETVIAVIHYQKTVRAGVPAVARRRTAENANIATEARHRTAIREGRFLRTPVTFLQTRATRYDPTTGNASITGTTTTVDDMLTVRGIETNERDHLVRAVPRTTGTRRGEILLSSCLSSRRARTLDGSSTTSTTPSVVVVGPTVTSWTV